MTLTWSKAQLFPRTTSKGGSRSSTRKAYGRCSHSWYCYKWIPPLVEAWSCYSARSWQRLEGMPLSCYFDIRFGRQSEDGRQLRVFVWCQGSSRAMTRISRWTMCLYQTQLNQGGHDVELSYLGSFQLAPQHRWWPWLGRNAPCLWAGQQWLEWSHNCHLSSRLKLVVQWQNPLRGSSINESVQAKTADLYRAYIWLLFNLSICHSFWHRPQYLFGSSANSISGRQGPWFYQC